MKIQTESTRNIESTEIAENTGNTESTKSTESSKSIKSAEYTENTKYKVEFFEIPEDGIEEEFLEKLDAITSLSNDADGTHYGCPDDADGYVFVTCRKKESTNNNCSQKENAYETFVEIKNIEENCAKELCGKEDVVSVLAFYYMGDTYKNRSIIEVSAFTNPNFRKQGLFRKELRKLKSVLRENDDDSVIRFAVYDNENAKAVLASLSAVFDHEEMIMTKILKEAKEQNKAKNAKACEKIKNREDEKAGNDGNSDKDGNIGKDTDGELCCEDGRFSTKYSECCVNVFNDEAYIYGVLTYDRFLRKGHAERMLRMVSERLFSDGIRKIRLEVSGENLPALRLYEKLSFTKTDGIFYYYLE